MVLVSSVSKPGSVCLADNINTFRCDVCGHEFISRSRYDSLFYICIRGRFCFCPYCHTSSNGFIEPGSDNTQLTFF